MALVTFPRLACRNLTLNLVTGARYGVRDPFYSLYRMGVDILFLVEYYV